MVGVETNYTNQWPDDPAGNRADYLTPAEFEAYADDPEGLLEWDDDDMESADPDGFEWDEPEPLAEYDDELRQPRYVLDEYDGALGIDLRIDQWVARIDFTSAIQRYSIKEILKGLGNNRLRWWLSWLDKQQWTGESLLLFLKFRVHWEASPHLWESSYWDWLGRCWYPTRSRYSLSLDDTYELVQRRLDHLPSEIIDEAWFGDWLNMALWQHGFRSFASFAVFRAGFAGGDNWLRHVEWYASDDMDDDKTGSHWRNSHHLYRYGPPVWFAEQNWTDPSEWHDNLGW